MLSICDRFSFPGGALIVVSLWSIGLKLSSLLLPMLVALDAPCQFKRSSCSFESFLCIINRFTRLVSRYEYDWCRSSSVDRLLTCSFARPQTLALAQPLSCAVARLLLCAVARLLSCAVARLLSCAVAQLLSCAVARILSPVDDSPPVLWLVCRRYDRTSCCCRFTACRDSPLPRDHDMTSCTVFLFRML